MEWDPAYAVHGSSPILPQIPLLEAHHVLDPVHKVPKPRPIGSLCELSLQVDVVCRVTGRLHDVLAEAVLLGESVVHEQVGGVGFGIAIDVGRGAELNARAEEILEVALLRSEAVEGPVGEEASVVVGDLLGQRVSLRIACSCRQDVLTWRDIAIAAGRGALEAKICTEFGKESAGWRWTMS